MVSLKLPQPLKTIIILLRGLKKKSVLPQVLEMILVVSRGLEKRSTLHSGAKLVVYSACIMPEHYRP